MLDLNYLIKGFSGSLSKVTEINDNGQIAVTGTNAPGDYHALLLSPPGEVFVPEPGSLVLSKLRRVALGFFSLKQSKSGLQSQKADQHSNRIQDNACCG